MLGFAFWVQSLILHNPWEPPHAPALHREWPLNSTARGPKTMKQECQRGHFNELNKCMLCMQKIQSPIPKHWVIPENWSRNSLWALPGVAQEPKRKMKERKPVPLSPLWPLLLQGGEEMGSKHCLEKETCLTGRRHFSFASPAEQMPKPGPSITESSVEVEHLCTGVRQTWVLALWCKAIWLIHDWVMISPWLTLSSSVKWVSREYLPHDRCYQMRPCHKGLSLAPGPYISTHAEWCYYFVGIKWNENVHTTRELQETRGWAKAAKHTSFMAPSLL